MCYSIADGGKRCFTHTKLESAKILKERMKQAEVKGDREKYRVAKEAYLTTEEGIRRLEAKGDFLNASRFLRRHNRLIDEFNAEYGGNKKHLEDYETRMARLEAKAQAEKEAEQRKAEALEAKRAVAAAKKAEAAKKASTKRVAKAPAANASPWSRAGIHRETGTKFNPQHWSKDGIHEITGTKWDEDGNDVHGYGQDGYHKETGRNRAGYDKDGYDEHLRDVKGFHKITGRNKQLLDRDGWGPENWNLLGTVHKLTGTNLDPDTFDVNDYSPVYKMFRSEWEALKVGNLESVNV